MKHSSIITPFRIVLIFIAVIACSLLVLPSLKVDLLPSHRSTTLTVSFSLPASNPEILEQQVTSKIEGVCAQLSNLKKINSVSRYDAGYIQLEFHPSTDMQFKRLELAAMLRQVYPQLPPGASYPLISANSNTTRAPEPLLVYSINAPLQPYRIREVAGKHFRDAFAGYQGIRETRLSGVPGLQLSVRFDAAKCQAWQLDPARIMTTLQSYMAEAYPGQLATANGGQYFLQIASPEVSIPMIGDIQLPVAGTVPLRIRDIAEIYQEEQEADSYFRINGNNSVTLSIYANEGENKILIAKKVKQLMDGTKQQLPLDFTTLLEYDDTEFLEREMTKNYQRTGLSALILVIFIIVAYRNWKYLVTLLSGLLVTLLLTILLAWAFRLNIHLYTIAGIAISFGLMIDNAIVMIDHYHRWRNRKIYPALLGATFTTIAALSLIFLLPEEDQQNLVDFAAIIMLALLASLITALWFTPGMYRLLNGSVPVAPATRQPVGQTPWLARCQRYYEQILAGLARYRKTFLLLLLIGFGLPVYLLPSTWEGNAWYHRWYNNSFGSETYRDKYKRPLEKWAGGSLRLFLDNVNERSGYRNPERVMLHVTAEMPYGNTVHQLNGILAEVESYLAQVPGIDKFVTTVYNGQRGSIDISFTEEKQYSSTPYLLKSALVAKSLEWGAVDWNIYGVGLGFTNESGDEIPTFRVLMKGYNYDELERQSDILAQKLLTHKRIQQVNTNTNLEFDEKPGREYLLQLDAKQLALHQTNPQQVLNSVAYRTNQFKATTQVAMNNQLYPLVLKEKIAGRYSQYDLLQNTLQLDSNRKTRIAESGNLEIRATTNSLHRENRQYIRLLSFEFLGTPQTGNEVLTGILKKMNLEMPVGYSAIHQGGNDAWEKGVRKYGLIGILILAIFMLGSILFENLRQPLAIICMIPVSFMGLFLTFYGGSFYFDQGGYAAFIMLGGLVANAAIFLINDFNNLKKKEPVENRNSTLKKAIAYRAKTILLTTISTCCGLIPFVLEGQQEVFWFSLAVGTLGGLATALFAIFFLLPVLLWKK
ncbi:efflux RND transporter permease subunit [Paraflavitalea sp. CAU 1676]|uniref:efflux RND transporter permease subunit n=1 Tax=Paraflavitalea sp. CAU 1676 TaxID=3032598 RepID=UPI0023DC82F6|nr:efflux RND transporter permease subunit [Paraflavitalea sp. CAU 1676]MDF2191991.1 efflux RND transporter permease subunit [Paraflavitalea sp. CAU 1676]